MSLNVEIENPDSPLKLLEQLQDLAEVVQKTKISLWMDL